MAEKTAAKSRRDVREAAYGSVLVTSVAAATISIATMSGVLTLRNMPRESLSPTEAAVISLVTLLLVAVLWRSQEFRRRVEARLGLPPKLLLSLCCVSLLLLAWSVPLLGRSQEPDLRRFQELMKEVDHGLELQSRPTG